MEVFFDVRRMKDTKSVHQVTIKYKDQKKENVKKKLLCLTFG